MKAAAVCGIAACWAFAGIQAGSVDKYPAVFAKVLSATSAEALRLNAMYMSDSFAGRILGRHLKPTDRAYGLYAAREWKRIGRHPYLARVLPDVVFYLVTTPRRGSFHMPLQGTNLVASTGGRMYLMPDEMNQLLYDSDVRFRIYESDLWARVGAIVWTAFHGPMNLGRRGMRLDQIAADGGPVFPEMDIGRVQIGTADPDLVTGSVALTIGLDTISLGIEGTTMTGLRDPNRHPVPTRFICGPRRYIQISPHIHLSADAPDTSRVAPSRDR